MKRGPVILVASHVAALGAGYVLAPRQLLDAEVRQTGMFTTDARKVLAATIESLREDNKLVVFSYKGTAKVQADRTFLWLFGGQQELIVPASVIYLLDLSDLGLSDVSYNEKAKLVTVRLPKVTLGEIAFDSTQVTSINGGVLTFSESQVEELRKLNYANARRAMVAQAQQPGLLNAAKRQAITNIAQLFELPLRMAGMPDVRVTATFD